MSMADEEWVDEMAASFTRGRGLRVDSTDCEQARALARAERDELQAEVERLRVIVEEASKLCDRVICCQAAIRCGGDIEAELDSLEEQRAVVAGLLRAAAVE